MHNYSPVTASVAGGSGYSGAELLRLLHRHPRVALHKVYAHTHAGARVAAAVPSLARVVGQTFLPLDEMAADESDILFLALPHAEAMARVPQLAGARRIVDLSGDFRLRDTARYEEYYGRPHTAPEPLRGAVYGFPELHARRIAAARLVANPGCYATAVALALAPLAADHLLPSTLAVVAASGVSGAGRAVAASMQFAEVNESMRAYKVGVHQHTPEIEQTLGDLGAQVRVAFIPHLLPVTRGIHVTATVPRPADHSAAQLTALYHEFYREAPFVRLCAEPPHMKDVLQTNFCDIHVALDAHADTVVILATIDNLVKGAAGQAIQNMNLMCGFPETEGLF
jgi:N-acetyl-gamma-glutamyl-phosphate reductase